MITWTPLFSKIVDSSIWDEPDWVVKIFITMIAKKDRDNIVRGNAYNIAMWSRKTEDEVLKALKVLSSPDTKRKEPQAFDGRRVEKVEEGWLILNGEAYQKILHDASKRDSNARAQAAFRARKKMSAPSGRETRFVNAETQEERDKIAAEGLPEPVSKPEDDGYEDGEEA